MDYRPTLKDLQKLDLHRHIEGSVRPATAVDIFKQHDVTGHGCDPADIPSMLRLHEPAADLEGFFAPFKTIKWAFVNEEAIARITYEAIEDGARDNLAYLELRFSPEFMAFCHHLSLRQVMDGVVQGVEQAERRFTTVVGLIVSISRHLTAESMGMPWPTPAEIATLAVEYADRGVIGLDLSGKESGFPPEAFEQEFTVARFEGLGITVHAGEDAGPESVRGAIKSLHATRIGHGVSIVQDPEVMRLAADMAVAFEICPTSNVLSRAVDSIENHPVRQLFDAGLPITINTDDPSVCRTTLTDEYALVMDKFGFGLADVHRMIQNALRWSFMHGLPCMSHT